MSDGVNERPTLIVVGSLNVDLMLDVDRLPSPGETVTTSAALSAWGGKGANQAVAAARLGARTFLVGAVGSDQHGLEALADLERFGVDTSKVARVDQPTGTAHVLREAAGENMIIVVPGANGVLDADHVRGAIASIEVDEAVVVSNCEISDAAVLAAATACCARGWRFVLNPAPARRLAPELLAMVSVLTPNAHEVTRLGSASTDDLLAAGPGALVVTRGADGVEILEVGTARRVPAHSVAVTDTIGAGDAFTAGLALGLASGISIEAAARLGNAAAALAVTGPGARGGCLNMAAVRMLIGS